MTININIEENKNFATVLLTQEGKTVSKKIALASLFESFKSLIATEKDTGYLSSNLLREAVKSTVCRAFYFKEFITDFKYTLRRDIISNKKNKYGIIVVQDDRNGSYMQIPNFKFTNIVGFISNSNTEVFNPSFYQIYCAMPDIFGNITENSKLVRYFPNQFDSHICWPGSFDQNILKQRDYKTQSTFVTQYLSSKFNRDLFRPLLDRSKLTPYEKELDEFFMEVCSAKSEDIHSRDEAGWFYLVYYFLTTIKNVEPATFGSQTKTLKALFQQCL